MAIAVGATQWQGKTGTSVSSQSVTVATTANRTVVVTVALGATGQADPAVASTPSFTFTSRKKGTRASGDIWMFEGYATSALSNITVTPASSTAISVIVLECDGLVTTGAADVTAAGGATSSSPSSGATATTTQADELVVGAYTSDSGSNDTGVTAGSGYTDSANLRIANGSSFQQTFVEYKVVAATGAQTASWTGAGSHSWEAIAVTFRGAAAAATGPPPPFDPVLRVIRY